MLLFDELYPRCIVHSMRLGEITPRFPACFLAFYALYRDLDRLTVFSMLENLSYSNT